MSNGQVSYWLDTILSGHENQPDPTSADSSPNPERGRLRPSTPGPSVTRTVDNAVPAAPGSPSERPADANEIPEAPRSNKRERTVRRESSSSYRSSQRQDDVSSGSGETCSLGIYGLEHDWYGVKDRELSEFNPLPLPLKTLLEQIQRFSDGEGILPKSTRRRFNKLDDGDMEWAENNRHYSKERQALGEIASPDDVRKVVSKAAECSGILHSKANWDIAVNSRVLDLALERTDGYPCLVNSLWISTASIRRKYNKGGHYTNKADFCIYLDLSVDSSHDEAISDVGRLRNNPSHIDISHTDFKPLSHNPIVLSIHTAGHMLDLGMWEAARWACLRDLLKECTANTQATEHRDNLQPQVPSLPEFLPAILVDGINWNLVVTTHQRKKTTIWHKILMGSTSSIQGIYQIIACLQLLRRWATDTFWPWMRELIRDQAD